MAWESKDEVAAALDALMKLAGQYERGQCVSWGEVEAITGPRDDNRAKYVIQKWQRALEREREIVTLAAPSVGLRLLTHKETAIEIPALRQRKAYRQIRRALRQVSTVDDSRLSDHERRLLSAQRANMAAQRRELFRSRKQLATGRITEVNPRRILSA